MRPIWKVIGGLVLLSIVGRFVAPDEAASDDATAKPLTLAERKADSTAQAERLLIERQENAELAVRRYLRHNLNDWDSYESDGFFPVIEASKKDQYRYYVKHRFRAKNSFGALVLQTWSFQLNEQLEVVSTEEQ